MKYKFIGTEQDLIDNGWVKESNDDDYVLDDVYQYFIAFSRRGQYYTLLIDDETKIIRIYATRPDGSGGSIELDLSGIEILLEKGLLEVIK